MRPAGRVFATLGWWAGHAIAGVIMLIVAGCGGQDPPQLIYYLPDGFRGVIAVVEDENGQTIKVDSLDVAEVSIEATQIVRVRNFELFEREHFPKLIYRDSNRLVPEEFELRRVETAKAGQRVLLFTVGTADEHATLAAAVDSFLGPDGFLEGGAALPRINRDPLVDDVVDIAPVISHFRELFPRSVEFVSYSTGQLGQETWNSITEVGGRGILTMQVPLIVDRGTRSVTGAGEPEFSLQEVDSVVLRADGTAEGMIFSQNQMRFGRDLWAKLYEAKGDLSAIGFRFEAQGERDGLAEFVDSLGPRGG